MADATRLTDGLEQECRTFSGYLIGAEPTDYIVRKYQAGHAAIPFMSRKLVNPFEVTLVIFAGKGRIRARIADAYARIFFPHGALRQKLVLLLAIMETAPTTFAPFTRGGRGFPHAVWGITGSLAGFGLSLMAALLVLGPVHLLTRSRAPAPA